MIMVAAEATRAAPVPGSRVLINKLPRDTILATNKVPPKTVTTAVKTDGFTVKTDKSSTLFLRQNGTFRPVPVSRTDHGTNVYDLKPTDVYVVRAAGNIAAQPLSTQPTSLPDPIRANVQGEDVAATLDVKLDSEQMEYNSDQKRYHGNLVVCLRSTNRAELVQKLLPVSLRLSHTAGIEVGTNAFEINKPGIAGCHDIPVYCSAERVGATVTVESDAMGDHPFFLKFERLELSTKYKATLLMLAGAGLGAIGGLVRAWQTPRLRQRWKRVVEGAFCGFVVMLLGQVGAEKIFHMEGPVADTVILGLAAIGGYLGTRIFEQFAAQKT
jgi:hypothetical protein